MNNSLVLVTDITGFVGQKSSLYLAKHFVIKGISRKKNPDGLTHETIAYL